MQGVKKCTKLVTPVEYDGTMPDGIDARLQFSEMKLFLLLYRLVIVG
jgi:hypothetical protein